MQLDASRSILVEHVLPPKQFRDRRDRTTLCNSDSTPCLDHLASAQEWIVRQDGLRIDTSSIYVVLISSRYGVTGVFVSQLHCTFASGCVLYRRYIGHWTSLVRFPERRTPCGFVPSRYRRFSATFLKIRANIFTGMTQARTKLAGLREQT